MELAMIQENIVPLDALPPAQLDRGLYFGDGAYEVIRSYAGKIFALDKHLHRFQNSLSALQIHGVDIKNIRKRINIAFEEAKITNAKIYFHITRGSQRRQHVWTPDLQPNFLLTITTLHNDPELKTNGIAVATHPDWRWKKCHIKSLNLLPNVLAAQYAAKKHCHEAILVDDNGFITEGAGSAFFAVFEQNLQTTPLAKNILPSISRIFVLEAAQKAQLSIWEKPLTPEQAENADELFTAATTTDILPVVNFDGHTIGNGKPGKITATLTRIFHEFVT